MKTHGLVLVALLIALASPAQAANNACPQGWLTSTAGGPQATTGPSVNTFTARAAPAVAVQVVNTAGTLTAQLEACCAPLDCTAAANWGAVAGGGMTPAVGSAAVLVQNPTCMYRVNATACTGCSFQAVFSCAGP